MGRPVVLGLDFGGSKIAAALCDLTGRRLATSTTETEPSRGARFNLERGISAAKLLLGQTASGDDLVAVGACTFGIPAVDEIRLAPAIPGWCDLSLGLELAAAFGTRAVRVATDVKAAASAEARSGALVGHDPGLYLNLGTGLAVAIVAGGKVISGANGAAGEIGYSLRHPSDIDLARADRIVLEEVVSGMALATAGTRRTGEPMSAADIFAAEASDPELSGVLDDFVRELSFHLVNIAVAIDPSRIAVGGGMVRSWQRIEAPLRRALDANVPYPPELVLGSYPYDAALVGALGLGLEAAGDVLEEIAALDGTGAGALDGTAAGALDGTAAGALNGHLAPEPGRAAQSSDTSQNMERSSDRGKV